jgi:hypothetical protein
MPNDDEIHHVLEDVTDLTVLEREISYQGCSFLAVAERGRGQPGFVATLGLTQNYDHPELVVLGCSTELGVALLALLSDAVRCDGQRFTHWSRPQLEGMRFQLVGVLPQHFEALLEFWCTWADEHHHGPGARRALQIVVPDRYFCAQHARLKYWLDDPRPLVPRPRLPSHRQRRPKRRAS